MKTFWSFNILHRGLITAYRRAGFNSRCQFNAHVSKQCPTGSVFCMARRSMATTGSDSMNVFDRRAKQTQRNMTCSLPDNQVYDYLKEEIGYRVFDRICDIKRTLGIAVDLGCGRGCVSKHLLEDMVGQVITCDIARNILDQSEMSTEVHTEKIQADEELIPFRAETIDMFFSSLSLHWVNDLPGTFKQIHNALKKDGCFIGAMFSGDTLYELRVSLQLAELEREGGFAPHISPFTSAQDLGGLLNRAGYVMTTIDIDELVVNYPSMFELMEDLKGMGESNCAWSRRPMIPRETLMAAASIYQEMYGEKGKDGVPATFQIIFFIGWKSDPSQMQPADRGSGQISIKDIDKLDKLTKELDSVKKKSTEKNMDKTIEHLLEATEKLQKETSQKSNNEKLQDDDPKKR